MNKCLLVLMITILMVAVNSSASMIIGPSETVIQFFEASKNGDVEAMKSLIAGPFYERRRTLLEMNMDYPKYLKKFYHGVEVKLIKYDIGNKDMVEKNHYKLYQRHYSTPNIKVRDNPINGYNDVSIVIVTLRFPDGSELRSKFLFKETKTGSWKIYDEVLDTN